MRGAREKALMSVPPFEHTSLSIDIAISLGKRPGLPEAVIDRQLVELLLAIEETRGYDAFVKALNDQVLDALKITIPGGLYVTASADLFESDTYRLIVRDRGAVVMHEMRVAMGRENLIAVLRTFYEKGLRQNVLGEYDLVDAMNEVTGGDWEEFLTDWLFNVDDYVDQQMDYYE